MHSAIPNLSAAVVSQIAGVVLFGDTRRTQTGGRISGLPASKLKIFCNTGDLVCDGTLVITEAHLKYASSVPAAMTFLTNGISAAT
jgi:cutinase